VLWFRIPQLAAQNIAFGRCIVERRVKQIQVSPDVFIELKYEIETRVVGIHWQVGSITRLSN
jgi:hypothetical protein